MRYDSFFDVRSLRGAAFCEIHRILVCPALVGASLRSARARPWWNPSSFPDGTYTATVERVVDAKHVQVVIDGKETMLTAGRATVDFSKVQANDQLKLSLIGGKSSSTPT